MSFCPAYFVTGTDTEIGKTFTTCALLHRARAAGLRAIGTKPVAAGVEADGINDDVRALVAASTPGAPPLWVNPYCFKEPVAPHIAAADSNTRIDFDVIEAGVDGCRGLADVVFVEGVGGFRVPLGPTRDTADLAVALNLPVILVVGLRLGCINHALLTADAIAARGLTLAGWVGNRIDPAMRRLVDNLDALNARLPAPCLGVLPHEPSRDAARAGASLTWPLPR